jgi:hypothetical protein
LRRTAAVEQIAHESLGRPGVEAAAAHFDVTEAARGWIADDGRGVGGLEDRSQGGLIGGLIAGRRLIGGLIAGRCLIGGLIARRCGLSVRLGQNGGRQR